MATGYPVWGAGCGEEFYRRLEIDPVDVLILDVGLPGASGFEIARQLSSRSSMGIVILSAHNTVKDRLAGLERGADVYLVKPIDFQELIANIEAVWRRVGGAKARPAGVVAGRRTRLAGWRLDQAHWILVAPGGQEIKLTTREYSFMRCLVEAKMEVVGKAALTELVWGNALDYDYHRLDVLLSRLRKKVSNAIGSPIPLKTVQSYGFAFTDRCELV